MPFSGDFSHLQQLACAEERPETHAETGEGVRTTLLTVSGHGLCERSARGDDVLEEAHQLTRREDPLDAFGRAVFLGFTAHDDEGQTGRHCCRSCQRDRPQSRAGKPNRVRLGVAYGARERLAEWPEDVRLGLEPVLV